MTRFLYSFFALIFASQAMAYSEVTCRKDDCMTHGWTVVNYQTGYSAEVNCLADDCWRNGWEVRGSIGDYVLAQCHEGGCFTEGWTEEGQAHRYVHQVNVCNKGDGESDCLSAGWSSWGTEGRRSTTCRSGDCLTSGWINRPAYGPQSVAYCKESDCFRYGWKIYP